MPGPQRIVRCSQGHLYTTTWMPFISLKSIRLGSRRFQRCPVGHHWALTEQVDPGTLTEEERAAAQAVHD
jgi:hypothetical protein